MRPNSLRYEPVVSSAVFSSVSIHAQSHPFLHVLGHSIPSSGLSLQWYYHLKKPFSISQGISVSFCQRQRLHFSSVAYSSTKWTESFAYRRNWNLHLWFLGKSPHHPPAGCHGMAAQQTPLSPHWYSSGPVSIKDNWVKVLSSVRCEFSSYYKNMRLFSEQGVQPRLPPSSKEPYWSYTWKSWLHWAWVDTVISRL